jgi:hypothetical protein
VPAALFSSATMPAKAAALHVCHNHCPVVAQCAAEAASTDNRSIVMGGVSYNQYGKPNDDRRIAQTTCPLCTYRPQPWPAHGAQSRRGRKETGLDPCGTDGAYSRHVRRKELIDEACREAHRAAGLLRKQELRQRCRAGQCPHPQHRKAVAS